MSVWKKLLWIGVTALGAWAVAILALSRGEKISALWIVIAGFCAFSISYRFYSKWLATKVLVLMRSARTPAVLRNDNKDYVPTNRWMVFGHHFAAIAGPGPLVWPVLAAQFGFLPGTLWILIGATLGGGVHDMIVLFASIRRGGKTLGQMVKEEIGRGVGLLALVSVLAIMIILLAVLALVVVQALAQSPWGVFTIAVTIPIALIMGIALRTGKVSVLAVTIFGLLGLAFGVWGGQFLGHFPAIEAWFRQDQKWLAWAIMIYGLAARFAGVDVADAARLSQHVLETRHRGGARRRRHPDSPDAAHARHHKIRRRQRLRLRRTGVSLRLHHHRLRRRLAGSTRSLPPAPRRK